MNAEVTQIAEYSPTAAGLAALRGRMENLVYEVSTPAGMQVARKDRAELRTLRTDLERLRVEIKAPALERCRLIDAEARQITAEIVALEEPINRVIIAEEKRREAVRQEAARQEAARIAAIDDAIDAIRARLQDAIGKSAIEIVVIIEDLEAMPIDELFGEQKERAELAKSMALSKLQVAFTRAQTQEAEAERLAAERVELAKQRAERDKRDRIAREEDAARRAKIEDDERAARERIEAQEAAAAAERRRQDDAARAVREREEAAAKAVRDAEDARIRTASANLEAEQLAARREQEERERMARQAKDQLERKAREKLEADAADRREIDRREQEARDAKEREERRKAAEISEGRELLQTFYDRFGQVEQFANITRLIAAFLATGWARAADQQRPAGLADVAKPRRQKSAA